MNPQLFSRSASAASARRTYELLDEPAGDDYVELLRAAAGECATATLIAPPTLSGPGRRVVEALSAAHGGLPAAGHVVRFPLLADSIALMASSVSSLYQWRAPDLPESLCLFRDDGSPWLITVAPRRLGFVELSMLERVRLSHVAPAVAASLVNRAARDAVLTTLERRLEERVEALSTELVAYATETSVENRDVLVSTVGNWLASGDDVRAAVAIELVGSVSLTELHAPLQEYAARLRSGTGSPRVLQDHPVLRDRWIARRLRLVDEALAQSPESCGSA